MKRKASEEEQSKQPKPERKEGPVKCTWHLENTEPSPHAHEKALRNEKILDTILDQIGHTPVVRINKISKAEGLECELVAKCEFLNAGGSVKDRIGRRMVLDAEKSGRIKPGDTLIEPTSGNTGIGLALASAVKGYRMIITLPEKMSQEKVNVLKGLGAEIVRTPTEAAWDSPESHIGVAHRLNKEIPNSHILDQYGNPSNPLAHYDTTAEEIVAQCEGKLDMVVIAAGTGGTLTGIARKLKEKIPGIKVVGVDPHGSILARPENLNGEGIHNYAVEGIGYDFVPNVLDHEICDEWIKTNDKESLLMARRLIKEEGLLVGGSSGTAMWAAVQAAKSLKKGQRCLVILPDSVRNYMTKFLTDEWMVERGFMEPSMPDTWWANKTVADLGLRKAEVVETTCGVGEAISKINKFGYDQLPVIDKEGKVVGVVSDGHLASRIIAGKLQVKDPVEMGLYRQFQLVYTNTSLGRLSALFNTNSFAIVVGEDQHPLSVATRIDLLNFISKNSPTLN